MGKLVKLPNRGLAGLSPRSEAVSGSDLLVRAAERGDKIVRICLPYQETMPAGLVSFIEQLCQVAIPGYQFYINKRSSTIITFSRNELVEFPSFEHVPYDFIFFIDDDTGLSAADACRRYGPDGYPLMISWLKRILDHDLNICGGLYCSRNVPHMPNIFRWFTHSPERTTYEHILDYPEDKVIEVDAIGTGFLCIKRQVLTRLQQRREENRIAWNRLKTAIPKLDELIASAQIDRADRQALEDIKAGLNAAVPNIFPAFWTDQNYNQVEETYENVGEDIYFCREAQKLGYKIYCDTSVALGHETKMYVTPAHYRQTYMDDMIAQQKERVAEYRRKAIEKGLIAEDATEEVTEEPVREVANG